MDTLLQRSPICELPQNGSRLGNKVQAAPIRSLRGGAIWAVVGSGIYAVAQWAQIALLAHLGSSLEVGQYALALGVCAPIMMLFNLQLRQVQATDAKRSYSLLDYLRLRSASSAVALVSIWITGMSVSSVPLLIAVLGLVKIVDATSDIFQGYLQQNERMDLVGRSLLFKSVASVIFFGGSFYYSHQLIVSVAAMAVGQVLCLLFDINLSYSILNPADRWELSHWSVVSESVSVYSRKIKHLFIRALPLGVAMMLISLYGNLPRFILNNYQGAKAVGIFAAISYLPMAGGLLVTAVGTAVAPRLALFGRENRPAYFRLLVQFGVLAAITGTLGLLAAIFCGSQVLFHLYGKEYSGFSRLLVWVMLTAALTYLTSVLAFGATALGSFKEQPWIVGIAAAILLSMGSLLVPSHGMEGAAIATLVATAVSLTGYAGLVFYRTL